MPVTPLGPESVSFPSLSPYPAVSDCWMLSNRTAAGNQIANPDKFPDGFPPVVDYIHSLKLKAGLYTAKGPNTCARFAASCDHEVIDALQWASWGIDYVKVRAPLRSRSPARTLLSSAACARVRRCARARHARARSSLPPRCRRTTAAPHAAIKPTTSSTAACGRPSKIPAAPWCLRSKAILTTRLSPRAATATPSASGTTLAQIGTR